MQQTSFVVAFLGGVAALFSPCAALLLPSFFAFAFTRTGTLVGRCVLFWFGLLCTMVPLGVLAGSLGQALPINPQQLLRVGAVVLLALGLVTAAGFSLRLPGAGTRANRLDPATPLATWTLGASYGLATGCTGPILGSVLTMAAMGGSPVHAALLMATFALGMVVPLFLLALVWDRLGLPRRSWLRPRPVTLGPIGGIGPLITTVTQIITGLVFVALGAFLLLTGGTAGGLLDAERQYRLENWIHGLGGTSAAVAALVGVVLLAGGLAWVWLDERDRAGLPHGD